MKRGLVIVMLLIVFSLYNLVYSAGLPTSPGKRDWEIAADNVALTTSIESKVDNLTITNDFNGTFTVLDTVISKMCAVESKSEHLATEIDATEAHFNLDLSKACAIEDNLNTIKLNLESLELIDTAGTFTALDALKQTVCSKIELLNNQLNEVQSDIADLTATEIDHAATIASQLDVLDQEVVSINSMIDIVNFDFQFNTACSLLDVIDSCLQTVESKVDLLEAPVEIGFAGTFTALDSNLQKACTIESLVDAIPMSFMADLSGTFSALNQLQQKICTIDSKVDEIDMSIMSVESDVDILDTTLDQIVSKLCILESKTSMMVDGSSFSLFDNAIQELDQECSILEILNNNILLEKACTIESNIDVVTHELLTQESRLDIIDQDVQTVASKVCAIQMDDTAISKLCLVDSKLDSDFAAALTIESIIDSLVGIESSIDVVDDLSQTILSKLCFTPDESQTICSKLEQLISVQDITESKLDLLLTVSPAAGSLCLDFGSNGLVTTDFTGSDLANAVVLQSDGKIIAVGQASFIAFALARYNSDGSLDSTFGTGGLVTTDFGGTDIAEAAILQPDGKIIAVGRASNDFALARYTSDGSLDSTFGTGGLVTTDLGGTDIAEAVALQPDGKIIAVGRAGNDFALVRYTSDGSLDSTFGTGGIVTTDFGGGTDIANAAVLQPDGKIIAVGMSGSDFALARYNSNGSLDSAFGTGGLVTTDFGGADSANGVALQPDGKIIAVGRASSDFALARYNSDGSLDSTFGTGGLVTTEFGGTDFANGVALQPDGKIIAVGRTGSGINTDFGLARYDSDGSLDTTFGAGGLVTTSFGATGLESANAAVLQPDGKLIAAGQASIGGSSVFALACYETGIMPIWFVKQEVELLCNQIDNLSTPTLVSKICLIEDQVSTIESTLDVVGPLIGMLNMQAQELIGDFQETWTILQVIEDKICISESLLDDAQTILDQLDLSGAFTPIEAIDQKALIVDGKVNTYESLVDAIVAIDFSGVFTALEVTESKVCLADDFVQSISAGLEIVQDALGNPIYNADLPFTILSSGRYYLAEDTDYAGATDAITISAIDDVFLDLNDHALTYIGAGSVNGIMISTSTNVQVVNGAISGFSLDSIDVTNCEHVKLHNLNISFGDIFLIGGRNIVVTDSLFSQDAGQADSLTVAGSENVKIKSCTFLEGHGAIEVRGAGVTNMYVTDCVFKRQPGTEFGIATNGTTTNLVCQGLFVAGGAIGVFENTVLGNGIYVLNSTFSGCSLRGVTVRSPQGVVAGNAVIGCSTGVGVLNSADSYVAFNSLEENNVANIFEQISAGANTYLGNFAFNSNAVGNPNNTNYNLTGGSDITRKFVTVSQTSSFSDEPTYWHNINMLP